MELDDRARAILRSKTFAHVAAVDRPRPAPRDAGVGRRRRDGNSADQHGARSVEGPPAGTGGAGGAVGGQPREPVRVRAGTRPGVGAPDVAADADIDFLARKYLGKEKHPFRQPGEERVTIVIEPEQVTGN